jgi:hypothetical protein
VRPCVVPLLPTLPDGRREHQQAADGNNESEAAVAIVDAPYSGKEAESRRNEERRRKPATQWVLLGP